MRLLPRTRRGTWAAAGVGWATATIVVWVVLPVVPRAEWTDAAAAAHLYEVRGAGPTVTTATFFSDRNSFFFNHGAHREPLFDRESVDGPACFWDAATGQSRRIELPLLGFPGQRFSHHGDWVLDHVGKGWGVRHVSGEVVPVELDPGHSGVIRRQTAFTADDRLLVYFDWSNSGTVLRVFDLAARKPVGLIRDVVKIDTLTPDGRAVAFRSSAGECVLASVPEGVVRFRCPGDNCRAVVVSPGGDRLVQIIEQGEGFMAVVWNTLDAHQLCTVPFRTAGSAPSRDRLFTIDGEPGLREVVSVRDMHTGTLVGQVALKDAERVGADLGHEALFGGNLRDGWASSDGRTVAVVDSRPDRIRTWFQTWAPWLGITASYSHVKLVDVATGSETDLPGPARSAVFSPDGQSVAVLGDGVLRVWDVPPRKPVGWFALAAGLLTTGFLASAKWRVRRLSLATPAGGA